MKLRHTVRASVNPFAPRYSKMEKENGVYSGRTFHYLAFSLMVSTKTKVLVEEFLFCQFKIGVQLQIGVQNLDFF